ncbi:hypothetical protein ACK34N_11355 [Aeromonas veronii]
MPELAISDFTNIAVATGSPKNTKLRQIALRGDYAHYKDYYLQLREGANKSLGTKTHHSKLLILNG